MKKQNLILAGISVLALAVLGGYRIVDGLRKQGIIVETDYMDRSVKAQMKYANKLGAKKTVIIGTQELEDNLAKVKDMETGEQVEVALDKIAELFA